MAKWKGWKAIIRDVGIIWALSSIGGFIIGIAVVDSSSFALGLSNILLGIIGFCISGCLIKDDRWKHLMMVAIFVWLTSIVNIFLVPNSFFRWVFAIVVIFIMMTIGGGLSFLFVKPNQNELHKS